MHNGAVPALIRKTRRQTLNELASSGTEPGEKPAGLKVQEVLGYRTQVEIKGTAPDIKMPPTFRHRSRLFS